MAKYNKNASKKRNILKFFITLLFIIVILGIGIIIYLVVNNNVSVCKVDESAKNVSNDEAKKSTPIIVNNILLGGVYNSKFVSVDKYFFNSDNKNGTKINLYAKNGKIGEYEISSIVKDNSSSTVFVKNSKENLVNEYFGISENNLMPKSFCEVPVKDYDYEYVKKSLGLYLILNSSIDIKNVYETTIYDNNPVRVICATNKKDKSLGAYSAIIIVDEIKNSIKCVKYNYVRNINDAKDFGILSIKFIADLNNDGISEIVIQDTREFNVIYSIFTYKNDNYYEVLSSEFKI